MSDQASTATSRGLPPQHNGRNGRLADFSRMTAGGRSPAGQHSALEDVSSTGSSLSQSLGNGGNWDIWGNPGIRGSLGTASNDRKAEESYLQPVSSSFETKSGSAMLGGDLDSWQKGKSSWTGNNSPALSNVPLQDGIARSPVRFRNAQHESSPQPGADSHNTRSSSPFVISRQGVVGQGMVTGQSPNSSLLESSTPLNDGLDYHDGSRGRSLNVEDLDQRRRILGHQRFGTVGQSIDDDRHLASVFGGVNNDESRLNRGRVSSNPRGNDILGGGNENPSTSNHRSESLPPQQHRANSTPPDNMIYPPSFTPTSHPFGQNQNAAQFSLGRPKFDDGARDAEVLSQIRHMGIEDDPDQFNADRRRPLNMYGQNQISQNPYARVGEYPYVQRNEGHQSSNSQSLWGRQDQFYDSYSDFRPNRNFDTIGSLHNLNTNVPDMRRATEQYYTNGTGQPLSPTRPTSLPQQPANQFGGPRDMAMYPSYQQHQQPYDFGGSAAVRQPINAAYPQSPMSPVSSSQNRRRDDFNLRSVLLEEFRANSKSKRYELKDIYNHVVEFSGDQHGSRFIQQKLETANSDEKDVVFSEIKPNSLQLMTDVFGNYVIQKFFEHGNQLQKGILAKQMEGHVLSLSLQMYGCRVVQKALEHILTEQQASLVKELDGHVLKCVKDQNGNHVIQKAIERVPAEHIQFIINAFHGQVQNLATHPYGCRVIQRMLEHCDESAQASILNELHQCTYSLVQDQYGNYVTQHVIEHGKPEDRAKIIALITQHLVQASKHKFASNVVEKSIQYGNEEQRRGILGSITGPRNAEGNSPLQILMRDQFGNYVIQKLLQVLNEKDRDTLVEQIKPQIQTLKKFTYGKQINAIEKLIFNSTPTSGASTPPVGSTVGTPPSATIEPHMSKSLKSSPSASATNGTAEETSIEGDKVIDGPQGAEVETAL